jgi:hypothetical protein
LSKGSKKGFLGASFSFSFSGEGCLDFGGEEEVVVVVSVVGAGGCGWRGLLAREGEKRSWNYEPNNG